MMEHILVASIVGSFLSLDMTFINNVMISRPIVAGPVLGWILGDITTGMYLGVLFEMLWSDAVYVGAAIPINITLLTALTMGCIALIPHQGTALTMATIIIALPMSMLFRHVEIVLRAYNTVRAHKVDRFIEEGRTWIVPSVILHGVILPLVMNAVLLFVGILLTAAIGKFLFFRCSPEIIYALTVGYFTLPILGFAVLFNNFFHRSLRDITTACVTHIFQREKR